VPTLRESTNIVDLALKPHCPLPKVHNQWHNTYIHNRLHWVITSYRVLGEIIIHIFKSIGDFFKNMERERLELYICGMSPLLSTFET
jgi:hypothetical protein